MTSKIILAVLMTAFAFQANADHWNDCQAAMADAKRLAFYGNYWEDSIAGDMDHISDLNERQQRQVDGLQRVSNSLDQFASISGDIKQSLREEILRNIRKSKQKQGNAINILEKALQLNSINKMRNHINNALNNNLRDGHAKVIEGLQGIEQVKSVIDQKNNEVLSTRDSIRQNLDTQIDRVRGTTELVDRLTDSLVGPDWRRRTISPYSKLGTLKRIMDYLDYNGCIQ